MIVGIDLGTRAIHIAGLDFAFTLEVPKTNRGQEIRALSIMFRSVLDDDWTCFIEEPVVAGAKNLRTSLQIAQVSGIIMAEASDSYLVPVNSWKKLVVGKGNAKKVEVAEWMRKKYPRFYDRVDGKQDHIDAECIRLYGEEVTKHGFDLASA